MRSVNAFDIGASAEFNVVLHGSPPIALSGTIADRKQNGPRYQYTIRLESTAAQAAAINRAVEAAQARAAGRAPDLQTGNGLTRGALRIPVDFDVRYTRDGGEPSNARATNISTGGILMNSPDQLSVGSALELRFLLGSIPVTVHGRVVAHQEASPNYNIAFYEVREVVRETLARFVAEHS